LSPQGFCAEILASGIAASRQPEGAHQACSIRHLPERGVTAESPWHLPHKAQEVATFSYDGSDIRVIDLGIPGFRLHAAVEPMKG
jgi:hypothetical protein